MGIKKITGVVLAKRAGFLKILLDDRKDDGWYAGNHKGGKKIRSRRKI